MSMAAQAYDGLADSAKRIWWIGGSKGCRQIDDDARRARLLSREGSGRHARRMRHVQPRRGQAYCGAVQAMHPIDLDTQDGWLRLVNVCGENAQNLVIISTVARSKGAASTASCSAKAGPQELGGMVVL